jgi:hypothetical protein
MPRRGTDNGGRQGHVQHLQADLQMRVSASRVTLLEVPCPLTHQGEP